MFLQTIPAFSLVEGSATLFGASYFCNNTCFVNFFLLYVQVLPSTLSFPVNKSNGIARVKPTPLGRNRVALQKCQWEVVLLSIVLGFAMMVLTTARSPVPLFSLSLFVFLGSEVGCWTEVV